MMGDRERAIVEIVERAEELSPDEASLEFLRAARAADGLIRDGVGSSNSFFIAGYSWYNAAGEGEERKSKAETYLSRAIALDPDHAMARLYLGHFFFDEARYKDAEDVLRRVDVSAFVAQGLSWRALKTRELLLTCQLFSEPDRVAETDLYRFYRDFRDEHPDARAVPWDLLRCFDKLLEGHDSPMTVRNYAKRLAVLTVEDGIADVIKREFPNLGRFVP
jgi:hypothetical protein